MIKKRAYEETETTDLPSLGYVQGVPTMAGKIRSKSRLKSWTPHAKMRASIINK